MRIYDDLTTGLQAVLLHWTKDYRCWVTCSVPLPKVASISDKWAEIYGTLLPAWKRQDRKEHGLPNAVAMALPVLGQPGVCQLVLMATETAVNMAQTTPWARERWSTRCIEIGDFVVVHEPRPRGDYAWTWRLQERAVVGLRRYARGLIEARDIAALARETQHWVRLYPMYGGVRRQMRRLLLELRKLWQHKKSGAWPGPDPEALPMMVGFRKPTAGARKPSVSEAKTQAVRAARKKTD